MSDPPWSDGLLDDTPPWVGLAALGVAAAAVTAGVLVTAAACAGVAWVYGRLCRR